MNVKVDPSAEPEWWQPYAAQFPLWHAWQGVNDLYYARMVGSSPPLWVRGAEPAVAFSAFMCSRWWRVISARCSRWWRFASRSRRMIPAGAHSAAAIRFPTTIPSGQENSTEKKCPIIMSARR
jgi:hypothetical protein